MIIIIPHRPPTAGILMCVGKQKLNQHLHGVEQALDGDVWRGDVSADAREHIFRVGQHCLQRRSLRAGLRQAEAQPPDLHTKFKEL